MCTFVYTQGMEQSLWRKHVPNRWHRYIAASMLAVGCSVISIRIYLDFDELGILFWFAMLVAGLFGFIQLSKQLGKWLPSFFRFSEIAGMRCTRP